MTTSKYDNVAETDKNASSGQEYVNPGIYKT